MIQKYKIEIKWGVLFILMGLAWMLMEKLAGLHDERIDQHAVYTNFVAIPAIAMYVFALLEKRKKDYQGKMNYKQGFISGLIITTVVTLLTPLSQWITSTIITPDYFNNVIAYVVEQGAMTQTEAEGYFNMKSYIIQSVIFAPVMGIITTAIVAFFVKKS